MGKEDAYKKNEGHKQEFRAREKLNHGMKTANYKSEILTKLCPPTNENIQNL